MLLTICTTVISVCMLLLFAHQSYQYACFYYFAHQILAHLSCPFVGMAVFGLLQLIPGTRDRFDSVRRNFVSCLISRTTLTVAIGGVLFGIGLTLAGTVSCITTLMLSVSTAFKHLLHLRYHCIRGDLRQSFGGMV